MPEDPDLLFQQGIQDSRENFREHIKLQRMHVIILIVVIVAVNLGVLIVVRYRMKREVNNQLQTNVQSAVSEYFALS